MQSRDVGACVAWAFAVVVKSAPETVESAVRADVAQLGSLPPGSSALVMSAVALARELDAANSATSKSMCARALREAMDRLRELAGPAAGDRIDELASRRSGRRAGVAS